jgi:ankyrin repeat protein
LNFEPESSVESLLFSYGNETYGTLYPGTYTVKIMADGSLISEGQYTVSGLINCFEAIDYHDPVRLKWLLNEIKVNPNVLHEKENIPLLHYAVYYGTVEDMRIILDAGADINYRSESGKSALFYTGDQSIDNGTEKARLLLDRGCNVNQTDFKSQSPLFYITATPRKQNTELIRLLLERGADPNVKNFDQETPLTYFAAHSFFYGVNTELVETFLIDRAKSANDNQDFYSRLFIKMLESDPQPAYADLLIRYGLNPAVPFANYSLLFRTLNLYLQNISSYNTEKALKIKETAQVLLKYYNAPLPPAERYILLQGDIYSWINLEFLFSSIEPEQDLLLRALKIDYNPLQAFVISNLIGTVGNAIESAIYPSDLDKAWTILKQARQIAELIPEHQWPEMYFYAAILENHKEMYAVAEADLKKYFSLIPENSITAEMSQFMNELQIKNRP